MFEKELEILSSQETASKPKELRDKGITDYAIQFFMDSGHYLTMKEIKDVYGLKRLFYGIGYNCKLYGMRKKQFDKRVMDSELVEYPIYLKNAEEYCEGKEFIIREGVLVH